MSGKIEALNDKNVFVKMKKMKKVFLPFREQKNIVQTIDCSCEHILDTCSVVKAGDTLTKIDIVEKLSQNLHFNKREAKNLVNVFFREIAEILHSGESVKLPGFGQFKVRKKAARPGRNPKTGEAFEITARSVATFQASQYLKQSLEDNPKTS